MIAAPGNNNIKKIQAAQHEIKTVSKGDTVVWKQQNFLRRRTTPVNMGGRRGYVTWDPFFEKYVVTQPGNVYADIFIGELESLEGTINAFNIASFAGSSSQIPSFLINALFARVTSGSITNIKPRWIQNGTINDGSLFNSTNTPVNSLYGSITNTLQTKRCVVNGADVRIYDAVTKTISAPIAMPETPAVNIYVPAVTDGRNINALGSNLVVDLDTQVVSQFADNYGRCEAVVGNFCVIGGRLYNMTTGAVVQDLYRGTGFFQSAIPINATTMLIRWYTISPTQYFTHLLQINAGQHTWTQINLPSNEVILHGKDGYLYTLNSTFGRTLVSGRATFATNVSEYCITKYQIVNSALQFVNVTSFAANIVSYTYLSVLTIADGIVFVEWNNPDFNTGVMRWYYFDYTTVRLLQVDIKSTNNFAPYIQGTDFSELHNRILVNGEDVQVNGEPFTVLELDFEEL